MEDNQPPEWLQDLIRRYRDKPTPQEMGEGLRRARDLGYTQRQLAEMFGAWQQNIGRWQNQ